MRISSVVYRLALAPSLTRVHIVFYASMLQRYIPDPFHVISPTTIRLREDLSYDVRTENFTVKLNFLLTMFLCVI